MRKLVLTVSVVILTIGGITSTFANNNNNNSDEVITVVNNDGFKEINLKELPAAVTDAILKDFGKATVSKAYVNTSEQYKISMIINDEEKVVYADKEGKWLEKGEVVEVKVRGLKM